jgi:RimJ/RimL family protein N-acetyltransferase
MKTARLELRPVVEDDRNRFVGLFLNPDFMVYSAKEALTRSQAQARFDHMLAFSPEIPFAKQAIIEQSTERTLGYAGADEFDFRGEKRLEFGYRLVAESRGAGYATEASLALLEIARRAWRGELLALIDPHNGPSRNVIRKIGFGFIGNIELDGDPTELYGLNI